MSKQRLRFSLQINVLQVKLAVKRLTDQNNKRDVPLGTSEFKPKPLGFLKLAFLQTNRENPTFGLPGITGSKFYLKIPQSVH